MSTHDQIDRMFQQGKLTADQARLLKTSLLTSGERKYRPDLPAEAMDDIPSTGRLWLVAGGIFLILLMALTFSAENRSLFFLLLLVMIVLGAVAALFLVVFNLLAWKKEGVLRARAMIATEVARKEALVPQIQEAVKAYADHESDTYHGVTRQRAAATEPTTADPDSNQASIAFHALAEQYPAIKADRNYQELFDQLVETENRITAMVQWYNEIAQGYNVTLETFPSSIVADAFSLTRVQYLENSFYGGNDEPKS